MTKHQVYLSLGSNLGCREENLTKAIQLVSERVGAVIRQSSFIETAPWGFHSEHQFMNAAILCETDKTPREVLQLTQQIEKEMGRKNKTSHFYSDRCIDIDILLYDDLKIPHPLMQERDFVMIPLKQITNP